MSENPNGGANQPPRDPETGEFVSDESADQQPAGGVDTVEERQQARQGSPPSAEEAKERYVNGETDDLEFQNELDAAADHAHETGQPFAGGQGGQPASGGQPPQQSAQPPQQQPPQQPPQQQGSMGAMDAGQRATGADQSGKSIDMDDFLADVEEAQQQGQHSPQGQQSAQGQQAPQGQQSRQGGQPSGGHERPPGQQRAQRRAEQGRNRQPAQQPQGGQQGQQHGGRGQQHPPQGQPAQQPSQGQAQQPAPQQQQSGQPQGNPPDMPDAVKEQNRVDPQQQRQQVLSDGDSFAFTYGAGGRQWQFVIREPQGDAVYDAQDVQAAFPDSYTEFMTQQVRQYGSLEAYQEAAMAGEADVRTPTLDGDGMRSVHELLVGTMEHQPTGGQQELAGPQLRQWLQTGFPLGLATIVAIRAIGMLPNMTDVETFQLDD